jgi:hypothetical protein
METGYKTHVSCLATSVITSKKIVLFRRDENYGTSFISIANLAEIYRKLTIYSVVEKSDDHFECRDIQFDIIIYLDEDGVPVGFTEFHTIQGLLGKTINIYIEHTIEGIAIDVSIVNSLENLPERSFLENYINMEVARTEIKRIPKYSKYTNNLYSGNIYLGYGFLSKNRELKKLPRITDIILDLYDNTSIGYCGDKLAIYTWNESSFKIISLETGDDIYSGSRFNFTEKNSFGVIKERETEILYGAGKYLVCRIESGVGNIRTILFDAERNKYLNYSPGSMIVDPSDKKGKILSFEPIDDYNSIVKVIPELSSTYFDLKKFVEDNIFNYTYLNLERKIGDLYCFRYIDAYNNTSYIISNVYFSTVLSDQDYSNCVFINENSFLVEKEDKYILYNVDGEQEFEKNIEIYNSPLNNYRKLDLSGNYAIPGRILGAVSGLIFYLRNNKINYL